MDDSTTTTTTTDTGAENSTTTDSSSQLAADQATESTQTTSESQSAVSTDDNAAWLQSKGIDKTDPEWESKLIANARNAEKLMSKATEQKAQLQGALQTPDANQIESTETQDNPVLALQSQVQALQMTQNVSSFWATNPDAKQYEGAMTKIVNDNPTIKQLVNGGYIGLDNLYQMAKGADPSLEKNLKTEGGREALQSVADKQQGKAVQGQATSSAFGSADQSDPFRDALLGKI